MTVDGVLNIYKEKGLTSHDVVAKVRKILKIKKVGHTGTLDPEAEGVLPICIGKATKISELLMDQNKKYRCEMTLGVTTTTEDHTGEVLQVRPIIWDEEVIFKEINSFVGEYDQIPPMYSAIRVQGKRLHELARQGIEIERKSRRVKIYDIDIIEIKKPDKVIFDVTCSKGTYIRTLCVDIGEKLGCGAHMSGLVRKATGDFKDITSIRLNDLERKVSEDKLKDILIPIEDIFYTYPKVIVKETAYKALQNGNILYIKAIKDFQTFIQGQYYRVYDHTNRFIGIYEYIENEEEQKIKPVKLFI